MMGKYNYNDNFLSTDTKPTLQDDKEYLRQLVLAGKRDPVTEAKVKEIERLLKVANEALINNQGAEAEDAFQALLEYDPQNRYVLRNLAELAAERDNLVEAAQYFSRIPKQHYENRWKWVTSDEFKLGEYGPTALDLYERLCSVMHGIVGAINVEDLVTTQACSNAAQSLKTILLPYLKALGSIELRCSEDKELHSRLKTEYNRKVNEILMRGRMIHLIEKIKDDYPKWLSIPHSYSPVIEPSTTELFFSLVHNITEVIHNFPTCREIDDLKTKAHTLALMVSSVEKRTIHYIALTACQLSTSTFTCKAEQQTRIVGVIERSLAPQSKPSSQMAYQLRFKATSKQINELTNKIAETLKPLYYHKNRFLILETSKLGLRSDFDQVAERAVKNRI